MFLDSKSMRSPPGFFTVEVVEWLGLVGFFKSVENKLLSS